MGRASENPGAVRAGELRRIVTDDAASAVLRGRELAAADLVPWLCRCGATGHGVTAEDAGRDYSLHAHANRCSTVPLAEILHHLTGRTATGAVTADG